MPEKKPIQKAKKSTVKKINSDAVKFLFKMSNEKLLQSPR